jgi:hypothetical protein
MMAARSESSMPDPVDLRSLASARRTTLAACFSRFAFSRSRFWKDGRALFTGTPFVEATAAEAAATVDLK